MSWLPRAKGCQASLQTLKEALQRSRHLSPRKSDTPLSIPDEPCLKEALEPLRRVPTVDPKPVP